MKERGTRKEKIRRNYASKSLLSEKKEKSEKRKN